MGEELLLSGLVVQEGPTWWIQLDDGQRIQLATPPGIASGETITVILTTPTRHQQSRQELAHHLLAEILNGS